MGELREAVTPLKPKVIGITESCSEDKSEGDINLVLLHTEMKAEEGFFSLLISLMNKAVDKHDIYVNLLMFGDFNFSEIDWKSSL